MEKDKVVRFMKLLVYLLLICGFFGSAFFSIKITELFHLFPYRIVFLFTAYFFLLTVFAQLSIGKYISELKVKPQLLFLGLWLFYAILSVIWSASKNDAIRDVGYLFTSIPLIFFVVFFFRRFQDLERFYYLWLLILVPLIGLGFWNHITGSQLAMSTLADGPKHMRNMPTAVYHNPNDYATYLSLSLPFVITFVKYNKKKIAQLFGITAILCSLYLILVTFSRANYLAALSIIVFSFLMLKTRKKLKIAFSILIVFVILFFAISNTMENIRETAVTQTSSLFKRGLSEKGSLSVRVNLIRNSLLFLGDSYGFGIGAGNSEHYMKRYGAYDTYSKTQRIVNVHNWWIEILVEYGIFIFVGYLWFFCSILLNLYRINCKIENSSEKRVCESLLLGLIGFALASVSSSSIMNLIPQWMLFAFALSFLNYWRTKQKRKDHENSGCFPYVSVKLQ